MIEQIKQALENATEGEWKDDDQDTAYSAEVFTYAHGIHNPIARGMRPADAQLVANIKPWLRYLLGEVEQLQSELDTWVGKTDRWVEEADNRQIEIEELQKVLEASKAYLKSSPSWNVKKYAIFQKIEQALERTKP